MSVGCGSVFLCELVEIEERSACVGHDDGATDDECDIECFGDLHLGELEADALLDVVADAVVASENGGGNESEEFLGGCIEATGLSGVLVGGGIDAEEAFDAEVVGVDEALLSGGPFGCELMGGEVRHGGKGYPAWSHLVGAGSWTGEIGRAVASGMVSLKSDIVCASMACFRATLKAVTPM